MMMLPDSHMHALWPHELKIQKPRPCQGPARVRGCTPAWWPRGSSPPRPGTWAAAGAARRSAGRPRSGARTGSPGRQRWLRPPQSRSQSRRHPGPAAPCKPHDGTVSAVCIASWMDFERLAAPAPRPWAPKLALPTTKPVTKPPPSRSRCALQAAQNRSQVSCRRAASCCPCEAAGVSGTAKRAPQEAGQARLWA